MRKGKSVIIALLFAVGLIIIVLLWVNPVNTKGDSSLVMQESTTQKADDGYSFLPKITEAPMQNNEKISFKTVDEAKAYVEEYAKSKGYDFNDYPEKLFELMVKDEQAIDYVLEYPVEINNEHSFSLEELSYDEIPLFIQWDKRWGYHQFKNGVVGLDGCGATCLSMAAVYLTHDVSLTPDIISDYAANNGYFVDGSGTSWDLFSKGVAHYGLKSKTVGISKNSLINAVEKNHPVIASVREGDFTKKGHYILIAGYENGEFIVNDPFSIVNSEKSWSWERIEPQIKAMWEIYS